ncbi:hypothetical protein Golob_001780 [Gossypium lobatum]|uniref:Metallothionein-like protein n=1 Tax=Gossypium lobatum TaxID=34289 RepID=A0A7J8NCJ8_9ROSI|nr:hypothetical protein [Gossypium lobatum]
MSSGCNCGSSCSCGDNCSCSRNLNLGYSEKTTSTQTIISGVAPVKMSEDGALLRANSFDWHGFAFLIM